MPGGAKQTGIRYSVTDMGADRSTFTVAGRSASMPLTHGFNTLTTGLVYNYNDHQAILSLRKYLKLLL